MTLSKYTDNLYQSEVYRELERQAVKKGFFKPTETELVKLAAQEVERTQQINQEVDASPSDDLVQDVARLAYAMRRKGFVTQAEDIEQKLFLFKTAENSLYNVTQDTNADLIGFAHRDGDVNLIEGSGDLGTFETMQSMADKILAVTRKQPTGKQPMNRIASLAAMINKVAQEGESSQGASGGATGTWDVPTPKSRRAVIANVENTLEELKADIKAAPSLESFSLYNADTTKPDQQAAYAYFARAAGIQVSPQSVARWYSASNVAQSEGVLTAGNVPVIGAEALYNKLQNSGSLIPTAQTETLRKIAYSLGVLPIFDSTYLNENNKSTYIFAGGIELATNNDNSWAACRWLAAQAAALYKQCFGEGNSTIAKAQAAMQAIPERLYAELNAIKTGEKTNDPSVALRQLIRVGKEIDDCKAKFTKEPAFGQMKVVNARLIDQIVSWVDSLKTKISDQYKSMATSDQMQAFTMDTSQLDAAYDYWYNQSQSEDVGVAKKGAVVANKIKQLQDVISENINKPWIELQDALTDLGIDAPNKNVFLASVRRIVESAKGRK